MDTLSVSIAEEIERNLGKGLLIILEGWDELPKEIRCNNKFTMFQDLLSGNILPEAVIGVTTRSSVAKNFLATYSCRKIEIVGFTKQEVKLYVDSFLKHNNSVVKQFWDQLKDLPHIKNMLFVPINLYIILNIFQKNNLKIPETYTELHTKFLLHQLSIFHSKTFGYDVNFISLDSLHDLPLEISNLIEKFGKMAYECLLKDKLTFSEEEINKQCFNSEGIPIELEKVDIFEQHILVNCSHISNTYQFVHRTLQELLAAWYVSKQRVQFQENAVKKHFKDVNLEEFWIFYAGLTKFSFISFDTVLATCSNYIQQSIYRIIPYIVGTFGKYSIRPGNFRTIATTFFPTELHGTDVSNSMTIRFLSTLLATARESQAPIICKILCNSYIFHRNGCWFSVPENASTPQILLSLSYCMAHGGKKFIFQCKKLDNDDAGNLLKYLTCNKSPNCPCNNCSSFTDRTDNIIFALDTSNSQHSIIGLVEIVKTQINLQWIILSRSKCVDDNLITKLSEALKKNTCVKILHLLGCNITRVGAKAIADMLKHNSTLEWIGLKNTTLKTKDVILLLETIDNYSTITAMWMLMLDDRFQLLPKVRQCLEAINAKRRENGIEKLCISTEECLKWRDTRHWISLLKRMIIGYNYDILVLYAAIIYRRMHP